MAPRTCNHGHARWGAGERDTNLSKNLGRMARAALAGETRVPAAILCAAAPWATHPPLPLPPIPFSPDLAAPAARAAPRVSLRHRQRGRPAPVPSSHPACAPHRGARAPAEVGGVEERVSGCRPLLRALGCRKHERVAVHHVHAGSAGFTTVKVVAYTHTSAHPPPPAPRSATHRLVQQPVRGKLRAAAWHAGNVQQRELRLALVVLRLVAILQGGARVGLIHLHMCIVCVRVCGVRCVHSMGLGIRLVGKCRAGGWH